MIRYLMLMLALMAAVASGEEIATEDKCTADAAADGTCSGTVIKTQQQLDDERELAELLAKPYNAVPRTIQVNDHVPEVTLDTPSAHFAAAAVAKAVPVKIKGSIASLWRAHEKWTPEHLQQKFAASHAGAHTHTRRTVDSTYTVRNYVKAPFSDLDVVNDEFARLVAPTVSLSSKEFWDAYAAGSDAVMAANEAATAAADAAAAAGATDETATPTHTPAYLWSGPLTAAASSQEDVETFADVHPVEALLVTPEMDGDTGSDEDSEDKKKEEMTEEEAAFAKQVETLKTAARATSLHIATAHVTEATTMSRQHTFRVQVRGHSRVVLFPTGAWERFYPYPTIHPGTSQQTQVDFTQADRTRYPRWRRALGTETVLSPGDVLYIPPLWYARVTHLGPTISVTVASDWAGARLVNSLSTLRLPLLAKWDSKIKVAALRSLIESAVADTLGADPANVIDEEKDSRKDKRKKLAAVSSPAFVAWTLLESRYRHVATDRRDAEEWCIECIGAGEPRVNQQYVDIQKVGAHQDVSGDNADPDAPNRRVPLFIGKDDREIGFRHGDQGWFIMGGPKGEQLPLYQNLDPKLSSLYGEYKKFGDGTPPAPTVQPCGGMEAQQRYCFDEQSHDESQTVAAHMREWVDTVVDVFTRVQKLNNGGSIARDVLLADYLELLSHTVVGTAEVRSFLHDFVHC